MLLTQEERVKFCEWLRQDIESSTKILGQLDRLGSGYAEIRKRMAVEMMAEKIVLKKLESTESQTLGGADAVDP